MDVLAEDDFIHTKSTGNLNISVVIRAKNKQEDIDPKAARLLLQRIAYPNLTHL